MICWATRASAFTYNSNDQVASRALQGAGCSACSGGDGESSFGYTTSTNSLGFNSWSTKDVQTRPDGNETVTYDNGHGQTMLSVYVEGTQGGHH